MNLLLRSDVGGSLSIDRDLWLGALDLAARHGWKPRGVQASDSKSVRKGNGMNYLDGRAQRITAGDAGNLARALEAALPGIPDREVPMQGKAFGEETTSNLIERAAAGKTIADEDLPGSAEILSGSPKTDARELATFLARGSLTIHTA